MRYTILILIIFTSSVFALTLRPSSILMVDQKEVTTLPTTTFKRLGPTIQIGILLDTSGSMDGLINQAKEQLWKIVNEVAKANKNDQVVTIEVGLFEYGKDSLPSYEGYLQMLSHLTNNLDAVSNQLFELKTSGGSEYAGKVILESVNRFAWSNHKDDLKILIIAGNEVFNQGSVPYAKAIQKAKNNNIIVNMIYCGNSNDTEANSWKKGASISGGKFFVINHNDVRAQINTPFDDRIIKLGLQIDRTNVYYGESDKVRSLKKLKLKSDEDTSQLSKASYIEKNIFKSRKQASIPQYDMVAAYEKNSASIQKIKQHHLPKYLQGKNEREIKVFINQQQQKRNKLQKQIVELEKKRTNFIISKETKDSKNLGSAIVTSIRKQAIESGFIFK